MLVENLTKTVHMIPYTASGTEMIRLMPGVNECELEHWLFARNQVPTLLNKPKGFKELHATFKTVKGAGGKPDSVDAECKDLADLPANEASRLVSRCLDVALLNEWKDKEGRTSVAASIQKQITELSKREGEAAGEDDEDEE